MLTLIVVYSTTCLLLLLGARFEQAGKRERIKSLSRYLALPLSSASPRGYPRGYQDHIKDQYKFSTRQSLRSYNATLTCKL